MSPKCGMAGKCGLANAPPPDQHGCMGASGIKTARNPCRFDVVGAGLSRKHSGVGARPQLMKNLHLFHFGPFANHMEALVLPTLQLLRGAEKDRTHHGFNSGCHLLGGDAVGGLKPAARGSKNGPGRSGRG